MIQNERQERPRPPKKKAKVEHTRHTPSPLETFEPHTSKDAKALSGTLKKAVHLTALQLKTPMRCWQAPAH